MKYYPTSQIRNIVLMGQGGCGKTSLTEAMLYLGKATDRLGKTADGNTVSDFDPEEIKRKISISASIIPVEWNNIKINVIDTPGYFDFEGEVIEGVRGADAALIVVSGKSGIGVGTNKAVKFTDKKKLPKSFFVTKLDDENADFFKVFDSLREKYGKKVCALEIPVMENGKFAGVLNIVDMKARRIDDKGNRIIIDIPKDLEEKANEYREALNEMIAEATERLMEKYFAGEPFNEEDTKEGLYAGMLAGDLIPVMCGSSFNMYGVPAMMDTVTEYFPMPGSALQEKGTDKNGEKHEIKVSENEPATVLVFKTVTDPYVGKMSYLKVISGVIKNDTVLVNARTGANEKLGKLFFIRGKKQVDADKVGAGDIAVVAKLGNTSTGDTLCDPSRVVYVRDLDFPKPCISMAVMPKSKGDEDKISQGMQKLRDEDLTFTFGMNTETKQQIVSGMGEMHIDVLMSKLKNKFGTSVELAAPKVAYREAIKKKVKVEGKHKKQSGGHGQYGHVWIEFEPNAESTDLVFEEKVFGGSVPKNFFPAVEKGLRDSMSKGILAGYPVVNLKATLVDGSYHPVDSSEMAFKVAASLAYKAGLAQAMPVLLEPIGDLKVYVPDNLMGDIIGDINKRRGQILGMNPLDDEKGISEVVAEVPMAEMSRYAVDLRSMTQGSATFTLEFTRYQEAPPNVAQKVIDEAKANMEVE